MTDIELAKQIYIRAASQEIYNHVNPEWGDAEFDPFEREDFTGFASSALKAAQVFVDAANAEAVDPVI